MAGSRPTAPRQLSPHIARRRPRRGDEVVEQTGLIRPFDDVRAPRHGYRRLRPTTAPAGPCTPGLGLHSRHSDRYDSSSRPASSLRNPCSARSPAGPSMARRSRLRRSPRRTCPAPASAVLHAIGGLAIGRTYDGSTAIPSVPLRFPKSDRLLAPVKAGKMSNRPISYRF